MPAPDVKTCVAVLRDHKQGMLEETIMRRHDIGRMYLRKIINGSYENSRLAQTILENEGRFVPQKIEHHKNRINRLKSKLFEPVRKLITEDIDLEVLRRLENIFIKGE